VVHRWAWFFKLASRWRGAMLARRDAGTLEAEAARKLR